jgi:hypothetical protein
LIRSCEHLFEEAIIGVRFIKYLPIVERSNPTA